MSNAIFRAYRYKVRPNQKQRILLEKHFGATRYIYNYFLDERIKCYENNQKTPSYFSQCLHLTQLKKDPEHKWLNEIALWSLRSALYNLDYASKNYFNKYASFPRFKSKKKVKKSFGFLDSRRIKINDGKLEISKFKEGIPMNYYRPVNGKIKQCTISQSPTGKYWVSILVEEPCHAQPKTGKQVGCDLGLKDFLITSDGDKYPNNRYTKKYEKKLATAQKHLSRKQKGSNRYNKQRLKVAKIHEKITNSRKDYLHKVSTELVRKYDHIGIEDLSSSNMVKNHNLAKSISDASWREFVNMLEYKAVWNDKQVVRVSRWFPSSRACCECGAINEELQLSDRSWICESCFSEHDRDISAAINILNESVRCTDNTRGEDVRLGLYSKLSSEKREAQTEVQGDILARDK